jgi:hypothetical protein
MSFILRANTMRARDLSNKSFADLLFEYCKDINTWPEKWEIDTKDIKMGEAAYSSETDRRFRFKPIADSSPNRSPIPVQTDQ